MLMIPKACSVGFIRQNHYIKNRLYAILRLYLYHGITSKYSKNPLRCTPKRCNSQFWWRSRAVVSNDEDKETDEIFHCWRLGRNTSEVWYFSKANIKVCLLMISIIRVHYRALSIFLEHFRQVSIILMSKIRCQEIFA